MIDRKISKGDILSLAAGNSFWRDEVVTHRAGTAIATQNSELSDPLVEITGGYIVKRADLYELNERERKIVNIVGQLSIPEALNGIGREERMQMLEELKRLG